MRNRASAILVFSLIFASIQPADAAIKSGSSCKIIGKISTSNGKSFICTKSAGKKIYKLVQKQLPIAIVKDLPNQVEVVDSFDGLSGSISYTAYQSLKNYLSIQPKLATTSVFMELSPNASVELSQATLQDMQEGFRFWQIYTPATTGIHMIFADREDLKWYETKMNQIQSGNESWLPRILNLASESKEAAYAGANGRDAQGNALFFYLPGKLTKADSSGWIGVGPHEWTHFAQNVMTSDIRKAPCWFKEGQATYYGNAISNKDKSKWSAIWKEQINTLNVDYPKFFGMSETKLLEWFKSHELDMPNDVCGPDGAFIIGGMATEYLVGTIGVEGVNTFMLDIGKGKDWKSAFVEATGKSYEVEMDAIVKFVLKQRQWSNSQ